jgi:hypothetical protein
MKVGDKVHINPECVYAKERQGYNKGKFMIGEIIKLSPYEDYEFSVTWSNGDQYLYSEKDLILIGSEPNYEIY